MFQRYKNAQKQSYVCSLADVVLQVVQIRPISIGIHFQTQFRVLRQKN